MKVFVSHSSVDVDIAKALIELIRASLNISSQDIRCTSVDGYRLPAGASTTDVLRREVEDAEAFIGLISNESLKSTYVLFELGARWGNNKPLLPLLTAGATPIVLKSPLNNYNALSCDIESQIYQFIIDLSSVLSMRPETPNSYNTLVQKLLNESRRRSVASVEFEITIGSLIIGEARDLDLGKEYTMLTLIVSVVNLSERHIIVDHYDLHIKKQGDTVRFKPCPIPKGANFPSLNQTIEIENPELHDLLKRTDSIAPGQGVSGLLMFMGDAEMISDLRGGLGNLELIIDVVDTSLSRHQTKVQFPKDEGVGMHHKLGFIISEIKRDQ